MKHVLGLSTAAALIALGAPAFAQQSVTATTDLNVRSGPGPQYEVIGVIGADQSAQLDGCLQSSKWCQVSFDGGQGWAYSDYLVADVSGREVIVTDDVASVPTVTYRTETQSGAAGGGIAGMATGAVAGAIIGGPVGAASGGVAGAATGSITGAVIDPPDTVRTYVREHRVDPVYLEGEVVVGATLPENVVVHRIPDYDYEYVYVNGVPAVVEPDTRRIVYVVR
jgi:uncharacterized protein YraI